MKLKIRQWIARNEETLEAIGTWTVIGVLTSVAYYAISIPYLLILKKLGIGTE